MPAPPDAPGPAPQTDPLALVLDVLPRLVGLLRRATASGAGAQLTLTQYRVLKWVTQGCRQTGQLARRLEVTPATVSNSVDALAQRGLLERLPHGADRRIVPLQATAAGHGALEAARADQRAAIARVLGRLTPGQAAALARGLAAVRAALDAAAPEEGGDAGAR